MVSEIDRIARLVEKTFERQPWYGPSILETLKDINPEVSGVHHGKAHSIAELVLHMTSWRKFVTRRLLGDNAFQVSEALNFPIPESWEKTQDELKKSQNELMSALKSFPENRLTELVPSSSHKYTYYTLLHGIVQHDIYHLGQIAYIKKATS